MRLFPALLVLAALTPILAAACGGKVVVDAPSGGSGQGGSGGAGTGGGTTGSGPVCDFPAPLGSLIDCGSSATSGSGVAQCSTSRCDDGKNVFAADCVGTSCTCTFIPADGSATSVCTCTLAFPCDQSGHDCCPVHQ